MHDEDSAIVRAVCGGDTEAFGLLVNRHKERLYALMLRQLGDPVTAEELSQETFVKAYTALPRFRGESSFGTWLIQIGIHVVRDHLRYKGRAWRRNVVSLDEYREKNHHVAELIDTHSTANPESGVLAREAGVMMRQAMADLPETYREIIDLKHGENLSYEEIARLSGDSVGTLKVRAHRARTLLRKRLLEIGWDEPVAGNPQSSREKGHV